MDKKQVFETVKNHLLQQKVRAEKANGLCAYKTSDGLKCAVGCLIKEEFYNHYFEGFGFRLSPPNAVVLLGDAPLPEECSLSQGRVIIDALKKSGVAVETEEDIAFLADLQEIHDSEQPNQWGYALDKLQAKYNL